MRGSFTVSELLNLLNVDQVISISGEEVPGEERVELGEWVRPALIDNRITIIAEKLLNMPDYEWKTADREYIKSITG